MFQAGASFHNPVQNRMLTSKAQCVNNGIKTHFVIGLQKKLRMCVSIHTRPIHTPNAPSSKMHS